MIDRADRSGFSAWWFTVDRTAFFLVLALIAIGMMLAFAASPAITGGPLTAGDFRYAARQITFTTLAAVILVATSLKFPGEGAYRIASLSDFDTIVTTPGSGAETLEAAARGGTRIVVAE